MLGSRLDIRQTGAIKDKFAENAKIIHIDIDREELGYSVKHTKLKINSDINTFLDALNSNDSTYSDYSDWYSMIERLRQILSICSEENLHEYIHPNYFFESLSTIFPP